MSMKNSLLAHLGIASVMLDDGTVRKKPIDSYPIHYLIREYNLIRVKKSNLSRRKRDFVSLQVKKLIESGDLVLNDNGDVTTIIKP